MANVSHMDLMPSTGLAIALGTFQDTMGNFKYRVTGYNSTARMKAVGVLTPSQREMLGCIKCLLPQAQGNTFLTSETVNLGDGR
jgi:hypothetical protein